MCYKIIVNPTAGRGKLGRQIPQLHSLLQQQNLQYDLVSTEAAGHATQLAAEAAAQGWKTVVGVGGDGTMNEVLNGIMGTGANMGFIPAGTGNDFARSLDIPLNLRGAVEVLAKGRTVPMDIGRDSQGYFSIILGLGFPSDVMQHVNTSNNIFRGPLAITASIVQVVHKLRPYPVHIQLDDRDFSTTVMGIFILNTRFTGGGLQISPAAAYDDGQLDIVIMHEMKKLDLLRTLPKAYKGNHLGHPAVEHCRSTTVKVTTAEPLPKLFDGNVYGESPVDAQILPGALRVWVPEGSGR